MRTSLRRTLTRSATRAAVAVTAVALAGSGALVAPADATTSEAQAAAAWLPTQLTNGVLVSSGFPNYGPTLDGYFALKTLKQRPGARQQIIDALEADPTAYIGAGDESYSGATGKLATAVLIDGRDVTDFGGVNLLARLTKLVKTSGKQSGRVKDKSQYGDYSNTFGQQYAVRAFSEAGRMKSARLTTEFLLMQQCNAGFFRESMESSDFTCQTGRREDQSAPSVDATALAVEALRDARAAGVRHLGDDIDDALAWLRQKQKKSGSFVGNGVANANSTGLAAAALAKTNPAAARRAARWVLQGQVTAANANGTALEGEEGAIAYNDAAFDEGASDGITDGASRNQWFLATAQAAPALALLP